MKTQHKKQKTDLERDQLFLLLSLILVSVDDQIPFIDIYKPFRHILILVT